MWDHELIVRREAPLKSHAFRIHVKDLVRLVGPPEKGFNIYGITRAHAVLKHTGNRIHVDLMLGPPTDGKKNLHVERSW